MWADPIGMPGTITDSRATEYQVPTRDGVHLATDVYLPASGQWPVPAVLIRMPYDKTGRYTFLPPIGEYFAAHGFACVIQDVRGKYRSEGERLPFENEANDGYDTVEWIIAQEWSNGAVGTWGDSYYGFTQWALASAAHPAHRAMVPRVTGHHFGDMRPGKGMPTLTLLEWLIGCWSDPRLLGLNVADYDTRPFVDCYNPKLEVAKPLLERYLKLAEDPEAWMAELFPGGNPAAMLSVPALHTGGWYDNLQFWQLDDWYDSLQAPAAAHQYLRMWTNDHEDYLWREPGTELGPDFGADEDALRTHVAQLLAEPISFFRHYLTTPETPVLELGRWAAPTVRYEHARVGRRDAAEWPPKRAITRVFGLEPGRISDAPATESGETVSWVHDPENPIPYLIESEWSQNHPGLPDEQHLHARDDLAVFTTDVLEAPLDLLGRVTFTARISAPTERTFVIARVFDVSPDGSAHFILSNAVEVVADGETPFSVWIGDTAYRLPAGHQLRLVISTSLRGQYVMHPGTDEDPWYATTSQPAAQTLLCDGAELRVMLEPR